jgi:hypothetical protein
MITMEFDDMKKIWNSQDNEFVFGINEQALHNRIRSKKKLGQHISNTSELLLIIVNFLVGAGILILNFYKSTPNVYMYILSAWMFATAVYVLVSRMRRKKTELRFDRSMRGEVNHALSVACYQVRLSALMRWNVVPMGILITLLTWNSGKPVWISIAILIFLGIALYASKCEHNIYKNRKRELEILQSKLRDEA